LLGVDVVYRPGPKFLDRLFEDFHTLSHFFHADEIAIIGISDRPDRNLEVVVLVVQIGMLASNVMLDA
jgi:hypothetical protein